MNDFNKKKQMANLLREDERYLPMHLHKTIDPLFPNIVGLENQKLAIRLLETLDINRGYFIAEFLGVSKFHENAAAMGVWVEKQMREKTYLRFDEVVLDVIYCFKNFKRPESQENLITNLSLTMNEKLELYESRMNYFEDRIERIKTETETRLKLIKGGKHD